MKTTPAFLAPIGLAAVLAVLAGCASKPDSYYTLASPVAEADAAPSTLGGSAPPLYIELAPVAVPERFARPQMVVRQPNGSVQVEVLEQHRWASSFENELRDALSAGIAGRLGAKRWVLAASILGSSLAFIDGTVVNVALPAIQRSLGASGYQAQWVVEAYALLLAALLLLGGALSDRLGRRRVFIAGVVLFALASAAARCRPASGS
jgi:uncharacterized lipoprotein YmbA